MMRGRTYITSHISETVKLSLVGFFTFLLLGASYSSGFMQMQMAEEIVEDVDFGSGENQPDNEVEEDDDLNTVLFSLDVSSLKQYKMIEQDYAERRNWHNQKKCHPVITPPPEIA